MDQPPPHIPEAGLLHPLSSQNVATSFAMDKSFGWLTRGTREYTGRQTR